VKPEPATADAGSCEVWIEVPGHGEAEIEVRLDVDESLKPGASPIERRAPKGRGARRQSAHPDSRTEDTERSGGDGWPVSVTTDGLSVNAALARSFDDLLTLRGELGGQRYYAAGVPWFSTLFGRDSLISAYQTLAFDPRIAEETLRLLARRQGEGVDDWRDEQPGKILHELRVGELARLHEIPHTPYFGSIDATPLFLVLLARHASWVGSLDLFHELRLNVERALEWIDRSGVLDDSGFVAYDSTTKHALMNQGWKDSGDAIVTSDGLIATPPIALAEVQGYVYAAKREIASLFERDGNVDLAGRLRDEAETLRDRFERAFWSEDLGCYALALEANGKRCEVATSNAGQVLWSGIANDEHAHAIAARLLGQDLFGGWGVRTLSSEATAYNPIGYHLGTVWPHDNGMIAEGLRRYGRDDEAEKIFVALIEAAMDFPQQRLPECFAGYARAEFGTPVRYPVACHPQAWAAGATPHLLTTSLGLVAEAFERRLRVIRPRLRPFLEHVEMRGLRVGGATVSLAFERASGRTTASVHAAMRYRDESVPLVALAGREYGSGSSRDWAAKGTTLLGIRAVIAESYERIHRSNLVGMGVLPLEFLPGETPAWIGLTGLESYWIEGIATSLAPRCRLTVVARGVGGHERQFEVVARLDGPIDVDYYRHGGILPAVLRGLSARH
jgi:glycogen debranching enzyme